MERKEYKEKKINVIDKGLLSGLNCSEKEWECKACKGYRKALPYSDIVVSQKDGEVVEVRVEKSGIRK